MQPQSLFDIGLYGFVLGLSLIVAIGAQNALVLRQGLLRRYVLPLCLLCAVSDAMLIGLGVAGFGTVVARSEVLMDIVSIGGAVFLLAYAALALRRAIRPTALQGDGAQTNSLKQVLVTALAFTFLNPHVYLDTVVLVGGLSAQFSGAGRWVYGLGAASASFVWFFALGYGARLLAPVFTRPTAWRVLDCLIAVVMTGIALSLLARVF